ncbi:MAG: hypothetical protein DMG42_00925 [Acidobacteria bacterium]|nr:MAG: hypothetical protein DMG42_00925 [Acidobacteriota bacterium]
MTPKLPRLLLAALLAGSFGISSELPGKNAVFAGLTAHEWGTFTSIAGRDGQAIDWLPLSGSTDLPGFVEHLRDGRFKIGLRGTVRMETPVLYFYDSREERVSVKVSFAKGVITEWYPHATRVEPMANLFDGSLYQTHPDGSIAWGALTVSPSLAADFPRDAEHSPYYSARQTSATPLCVRTPTGEQHEKFLFYRGVSTFRAPLSAKLTADGKVQVQNDAKEEIPNTILFERRGEQAGYRIAGAIAKEAALDPPELTGSVDDLRRELVGMLVAQGLYLDEAQAMVETWRGSWLEEGSRLLYIVPRKFVNEILPLSIDPAPAQIARVFVGRLELITARTENAVETAFAAHDKATLEKYGRFLEPILRTMLGKDSHCPRVAKLNGYLNTVQASLMAQARGQK